MAERRADASSRMAGGGRLRCAIYTRKSTEEGLEQEFNSLDAQREACAAYILSQRHEGWTTLPGQYDDGGFSGGNMDRPGLRQLLAEVRAGRVDVIVVYKVDRLTRSLADFAKIVEVLDAAGASFVSVTQAFNTTTSMGRLTLNVLLSFAQFEREVTGERIRDKIAASKAKGMWMGGVVPLGYAVADRKLVIAEPEAGLVCHIFRRYLQLGSVPVLKAELDAGGMTSPLRLSRRGRELGGRPFTLGALYAMLQNRVYVGEVCHKGTAYPGEHQALLPAELFEAAKTLLERNRVARAHGDNADEPSLLAGILWDGHGRRMSPSHAVKRSRRYRYYVSRTDSPADREAPVWRVPAGEIEEIVTARVAAFLRHHGGIRDALPEGIAAGELERILGETAADAERLRSVVPSKARAALIRLVERVELADDSVSIVIRPPGGGGKCSTTPLVVRVPARLVRAGRQVRIAIPPDAASGFRDPALIRLLSKAHQARAAAMNPAGGSLAEVAAGLGVTRNYLGRLLRLSYLAPDIVTALLEGKQPAALTRQRLARLPELPVEWEDQRRLLGLHASAGRMIRS